MSTPIRVRIAPSPSGHLHVGTARTAVFNWLFARKHGGTFILRIEDTDKERSFDEFTESIQESLRWLGCDWDEGPVFQSQRGDLHRDWVKRLCATDSVYQCWATPEESDAARSEARKAGRMPRYELISQNLSEAERAKRTADGFQPAWRLRVGEDEVRFDDIVYGEQKRAGCDIDEFVVARGDGTPTYNFACVIDDSDMRISHVIRGNDHITNTFKQVLVYRALGLTPPVFAHLPLCLGTDRRKISKRESATSITEYRAMGYLPEAMVNFLALLGWSPGDDREILTMDEMTRSFSLERINQSNPIFDLQKLEWMNGEYIRALDNEELLQRVIPVLIESKLISEDKAAEKRAWLLGIVSVLRERMLRLSDAVTLGSYFFGDDFTYEDKGVRKHFSQPGVDNNLTMLAERFGSLDHQTFDAAAAEATLRALAEEFGQKPADLIHPLRLALSGRTTGPGIFEIVALLGRDESVKRIERAVSFIRSGDAVSAD